MSLASCPHCWDDLCCCGYEYRNWTVEQLKEQIKMLQEVLKGTNQYCKKEPL